MGGRCELFELSWADVTEAGGSSGVVAIRPALRSPTCIRAQKDSIRGVIVTVTDGAAWG